MKALKHQIKRLLVFMAEIVMAKPGMKMVCKKILSQFPWLYRRLCTVVRTEMIAFDGNDFSRSAECARIRCMPGNVFQTYLRIRSDKKTKNSKRGRA